MGITIIIEPLAIWLRRKFLNKLLIVADIKLQSSNSILLPHILVPISIKKNRLLLDQNCNNCLLFTVFQLPRQAVLRKPGCLMIAMYRFL